MRRISICAALAAALLWASGGAQGQADANKVLHVAFPIAETGFDPQASSDLYSNFVNRVIFDPLYRYDYLARPYSIVPNTATAMPESSADGKTWTFHVKPGIYFTDDPVFKGKKRELTAADYAFSWKRILDPRLRSPQLDVLDGKILGMEALVAKAKETGKFDYDAPLAGLLVLDRYTLQLKLNYPWFDVITDLTTSPMAAVAREVVEAYGDGSGWVMANPVGTGPYRLKDWRRAQKIVLEANAGYRDVRYPESADPADRRTMAAVKGKRIPLIGRVEIAIIEETNPRLLAFEKGELDYVTLPSDLVANVLEPDNKLNPRFANAGVLLARGIQPAITYTYFNMDDPVVGGYTNDRIALRRAIGMAYNVDEEVRVLRQGQGTPATQIVPPGVSGYDAKFSSQAKFDPAGAKALLDKFGFKDRDGDGFREMPDGKPLVLRMGTTPSASDRQYNELWQRSLAAVGIKVDFQTQKWPDMLKMARSGQVQIWQLGNTSTTTDGYGFLGLLYGGNSGLANLSRFKQQEYDRLYEASRRLPEGPERNRLVREMSQIAAAYAPWKLNAYRYESVLVYPWVIGYDKYNAFNAHPWQYLDIDLKMPRKFVQ